MKLTTIPIAVVLFGLVPILLVLFYNEANTPLHLAANETTINSTYNKFIENSERIATVNDIVKTSQGEESGGNFLSNIGKIWSAIKNLGGSFGEATDLTYNAGKDLGIPYQVRIAGLSILAIVVLGILIGIAARWGRV